MSESITRLVKERVWAVVGVSNHHDKFGRQIFEQLRSRGYEVFAITARGEALDDGTPTYANVQDLPVVPAVVDVVVPPAKGKGIVEDCHTKGVRNIWFQPGAESEEAVELGKALGLTVISGGACAMVETSQQTW